MPGLPAGEIAIPHVTYRAVIANEPPITPALVAEHGLKPEEYQRILDLIGREPSFTELGIFSAMWNEHCSYKSSKVHLRNLPTKAPWVIQGPGENAGVIDIGDGLAVVFKMESHNHPSYIEPYQGAATGVGGILRDVFTMGARPIACLNALCLRRSGASQDAASGVGRGRRRRRLRQFVRRADGRRPGALPHPLRRQQSGQRHGGRASPRTDKIFYAAASGVGMPIVYLGSKTGRDGIHGASMASAEFGEGAEEKRPTVQVGDPFSEKLLLEACLEIMAQGLRHRHPGHGRGGADLLGGRDGRQGQPRRRSRTRQGAVPRDRHERLRDDALGKPGAHAHGAQAREGSRGRGDLPQMGARLRHRRRHHAEQALHRQALPATRRSICRSRSSATRRRSTIGPTPTRRSAGGEGFERDAADAGARRAGKADRHAGPVLQALGLGAVRPRHPRQHRAAAGRRRRGGARQRRSEGAGAHRRCDAALLRGRSVRGRQAGGGGSLAQHHRRRRQAAGDHRQSEFRQSRRSRRSWASSSAACAASPRPARRSTSPSCPATSRSTTRRRAAASCRRRASAASACSPTSPSRRRSPSRPRARRSC